MTWQTYQDLDSQQPFEIVGQWGFTPTELTYNGTLHYQPQAMHLLLTGTDLTISQHQQAFLYGHGTVVLPVANGAPIYLPVKVSLSGIYPIHQQQTFQGDGQQAVLDYGVLGMVLGGFVTGATRLAALQLDLLNLTAWLQPAVGTVKRSSTPTGKPQDWFQFMIGQQTYQLLTTTRPLVGALLGEQQVSGFQVHQSIGVDLGTGGSLREVSLIAKQVADWLAVVSGRPTVVTRLLGQAGANKLMIFETTPDHAASCDFRFTRLAIPRDNGWYQAMALSLRNWLMTYDKLVPVVNTLTPTRPVQDINGEIQRICNCLNVIFDAFYKNKGRKKEVYYRRKVKIVLENCERQDVQQAMGALSVVRTTNQLLDLIRDARNVSAHSSLAVTTVKGLTTIGQKYRFQLVMKTLLRLWLLHQLGVSPAILAAEVRLAQPFEVAMTQTW
ncbi:hypothetical protein [Lactiplantibacillus songbeiensis]|uniref:ApeA N-terminal domain-containing protein n=1 Tax=Lactiplantibacillus songbeiensis TaxID=2559920 RepID=A0ABW4C4W5_9LACO|nr:hypothetical protein [Lactiplantibacillus songbeiensis]